MWEMEYRDLGRTGWKVSAISLGTWAMGSLWGATDTRESLATLNRALDMGVNFFDTADAYGSEALLGTLRRQRKETFYIATKMGMGVNPDPRGYNRRNLSAFVENSLRALGTETIDLMQLHCPPIQAYNAETFGILDDLVSQGKLRFYGVSVERLDEARAAVQFPEVQSVMIVFNLFRQRPIEDFFPEAVKRKVGIIARVPMASGLLTGKMTRDTKFERDDHRAFNRNGAAFDKGETFSGIDFNKGLLAVEELRLLVPTGMSMAQLALRWILMQPAVSCAVPGGRHPSQVEDTLRAADLPPLTDATMQDIRKIYDKRIRPDVHALW
jgi:aryl-alcohol dehydrogenase-like predicted oxidoreductase